MSPEETVAFQSLLRSTLSPRGYDRVNAIIQYDDLLARAIPEEPLGRGQYWIAVYGQPGADSWGWRLEGHHLSLHLHYGQGASSTPLSMGVQPLANVTESDAPLGARARTVRAALGTLTPDQRQRAAVGVPTTLGLLSERLRAVEHMPTGQLRLDGLTGPQLNAFLRVIDEFIADVPDLQVPESLAGYTLAAIVSDRREYMLLAGGLGTLEYENVAGHIHSVWRSARDFGRSSR